MRRQHIQHLYSRISFGISPKNLEALSLLSKEEVVNDLLRTSKKHIPLEVESDYLDGLSAYDLKRNKEEQKLFNKNSAILLEELNHLWVLRLAESNQLLREKMTLFWSNHFVCSDNNIVYFQKFNNTLREHALGDFRDFVKAISREASMIKYLNIKQNRKLEPNENFARELMELFTLGVGNYTEEDVKESAKAFTGYNHSFVGDFKFYERHHDDDFKMFLGKTGRYDGDDIIDIILDNRQCANFICEKIYRYFVNDKIRDNHINEMVAIFYPSYNIEALMQYVLLSDWFYNDVNIGSKIKSPIELLVGIQKVVPVEFQDTKKLLRLQRLLGQRLFSPPNVAGWKGGKSWIDSNTIMLRLKLASILLSDSKISTANKNEFIASSKARRLKYKVFNKRFQSEADWQDFSENYRDVTIEDLEGLLIQSTPNSNTKSYLDTLVKQSKKAYCVQLMSLPEYQMC